MNNKCLDVSLLRDASLKTCNFGDEEILSLADGHPNSPDVCLNDCGRVSDASIVALAKQCIQLNSIDIGKCIDTTDGGHAGFPCRC